MFFFGETTPAPRCPKEGVKRKNRQRKGLNCRPLALNDNINDSVTKQASGEPAIQRRAGRFVCPSPAHEFTLSVSKGHV